MGRRRQGRLLGMPYDWRRPTLERLWRSVWNPSDRRILVPKGWGWGYGVNVAAILRRIAGR